MLQGDNFRRNQRPTIQQIQYLLELEKTGTQRGFIAVIAQRCGVTHGAVSRYLKSCCEHGYLTGKYEFTKSGKIWLRYYKGLMTELAEYFQNVGIPQKEIPEHIKDMIENVDAHVLSAMLRNHREMKNIYSVGKREMVSKNFLSEVLGYGNYNVYFALYRIDSPGNYSMSMANRGFVNPAYLRHNKRVSRLELTICKMQANSRVSGETMEGYLQTLKYEQDGILRQAEIKKEKLWIPLAVFHFHKGRDGSIRGMLPVMVTCNVGRVHMPESTAMLIFWI